MANQTQLMDTGSPSTPPAGPTVLGYLKVPAQGELEVEKSYPVMEGERERERDIQKST